ncbi:MULTISPECIES: hypothetical protein [Halorubellus]|uniref:DUF6199 domain-containing protein n=1 Tax=Halorubellus litoreus TaxID=755308 RepID=A0ABD5VG16_9EURY|nr:hypothetical protein [Halorubellus salinus]
MSDASWFAFGVCLFLYGAWLVAKPRAWANFSEQLDAIGSDRDGTDVEATESHVTANRYGGYAFALVGLAMISSVVF